MEARLRCFTSAETPLAETPSTLALAVVGAQAPLPCFELP